MALSQLLREPIRAAVDDAAPTELGAGGSISSLLASSLASITVESTIEIEDGGDGVFVAESGDGDSVL